jgi:PAS domain S-box-containing protein
MAPKPPKKNQSGKKSSATSKRRTVARPRKPAGRTTEHKQAEDALRANEASVRTDLKAVTTLHALGMLSLPERTLESLLEGVVEVAIDIARADFGNIQLLEQESGDLKIVAQRGFPDWWVAFWNGVAKGKGVCGTALERGERVIVEDVEASSIFIGTPELGMQRQAGVRAVQSTPLKSRSGRILGMFSTHYRMPKKPDKRTMRLLDFLAQEAADLIEHFQDEEALHDINTSLKQRVQELNTEILLRQQAEDALREREKHFRSFFNNAAVGAAQINPAGRFIHVNDRFCQITGYQRDELIGKMGPLDLDHPDEVEADRQRIAALFHKGTPYLHYEKRYTHKDGHTIWVHVSVAPIRDEQGTVQTTVAIIEDATERKEVEASLRKTQDLLQDTEKIGHVGGWEFDIDTKKQTWTDEVYRIHEVSREFEPTVDKGIAFYEPESRPIIERVVQRAIESGEPFDVELKFLTAKGNHRWVHAIGRRDLENRRVYGFFQDITERKQAEEALAHLNATLERRVAERTAMLQEREVQLRDLNAKSLLVQEEERRRIARELHDDFTQRLAALTIDLQSLRPPGTDVDAAFSSRLGQLGKQAEQLTANLQRLSHHLHPSILEHVGLEAAVREHAEDFEARTSLKTELMVRALPDTIPLDHAICLYRVLQESLQNVRKHANATAVLIRLLKTDRGIGLCVHDDGRGFEPEQEIAKPKGLGLTSMAERVKALQGTFRIKTKPGNGTEVHAWVPVSDTTDGGRRMADR